VGINYKLIW